MKAHAAPVPQRRAPPSLGAAFNLFVIGLTAFLTVVDLFATQAILPALAQHYAVSAAAMGVAVNASTAGMAIAGLLTALFSSRINRRLGVMISLWLLAVPTALLGYAPDLASFAALRVAQGLLMAAAFALTLAHLGERCTASASASAFAAYVTGNVASNLFGRLMAVAAVEQLGLHGNFYLFALLNLAGALLVYATLSKSKPLPGAETMAVSPLQTFLLHMGNPSLRLGFGLGFCILFAFIGIFTYVNFVLVAPPLLVPAASLGLVYFVFAPSILTTPLAGQVLGRLGVRGGLFLGLGGSLGGLLLLVLPNLAAVLLGLALVASGLFLAQAMATGFVSRAAHGDRGAASGLYLAFYFCGGLAGSAVLGQLFERVGWVGTLLGAAAALIVASLLAARIREVNT